MGLSLRPLLSLLLLMNVVTCGSHLAHPEGNNLTTFRWSYFPTHDTMRFAVFNPPVAATHWRLSLSSASPSTAVIAQLNGSMPVAPTSGQTWAVPRLDAGMYVVTLQLMAAQLEDDEVGESATPLFTQADSLNRTVRPWEKNALGMDDILIPPFTPLTVTTADAAAAVATSGAGTRVGAIAREMILTELGLWSQVAITPPATPRDPKPAAINILAKPITLVAHIAGKDVTATGKVTTTKTTPTAVETTSSWSAGPLSGSLDTHYDPDGCMRVELTLQPTTTPISTLRLLIPLRLSEAPFMHAVTDLLRQHYAGRIPPGEGEVYNTTAITRYQLPGPFVPYLWVGGAARGIAFFADNDKDWLSMDPAYQLLRDSSSETLTLVVNLISRSSSAVPFAGATLARTRKLVFGLMASPAKPQPAAPVKSPRDWWLVGGATQNQVSLEFLGADYYWGAQTPCLQYYPFRHNYSVYDWFTSIRTTGSAGNHTWGPNGSIPMDRTHDYSNDWIRNNWMPLYTPANCETCTAASLWNIYESVQYSMNQMLNHFKRVNASTGPGKGVSYVAPYTNARGVIWDDDTAQFMDEWTEYDIADPRWPDPALGGGDAPWCRCPSEWCEDVNYQNPHPHPKVSCSAAGAKLLRFQRNQSAELSHNASVGRWAGYAYQTDPVKSYADMVLHYTKKMLDTFADGIYYDDTFFHANFNPAPAGPAYVDDSGQLRAGVSLWAWRDFLRRSATLQHTIARFQGTKPTVLYIHMTNVNLIPLLSWGSVNLDWEWRDAGGLQEMDVQTRNRIGCDDNGQHCNDTSFILAQTAGLQAGNIPIAISSGLRGPNCTARPDLFGTNCTAWLMKTQYATCIPHEVRPEGTPWGMTHIPGSPDGSFEETPTTNNVSTVLDLHGYSDPRCDIYRFWEEPLPIQTHGATVLPLVVHCPASALSSQGPNGHVLIFFGSFGPTATVNFRLSPSLWKVDATTTALNVESGDAIQRVGSSDNFTFNLDKHSFKMVMVKTDDESTRTRAAATAPNRRAVSWWANPETVADADGLVAFVTKHRSIVTTVILQCGVVTCCRTGTGQCGNEKNSSLPGYRYTCTNNHGIGGVVTGKLSAACAHAIPKLTKLGVRCEIWLGQDDSLSSARYLFAHAQELAMSLIQLARDTPGLVGFNIDLEERYPQVANHTDLEDMASFLSTVTTALNEAPGVEPLRFSVDVSCKTDSWVSGDDLETGCAILAQSSVNKMMDMGTYNAADYSTWAHMLDYALKLIPIRKLGAGLGCWIDSRTKGTWNVKPQSAIDRVCLLMNKSVDEIDMFVLRPTATPSPFPEPFWIPVLERYMGGGGCDAKVPAPLLSCPNATVGPRESWVNGGGEGCCTSHSLREDPSQPGRELHCDVECAQEECAAANMVWRPQNYSIHPYECCHS